MKKRLMYLMSCLLLALCFVTFAPKTASAATSTYKTIIPLCREDLRDKVGDRYFFTGQNSSGTDVLRWSSTSTGNGYIITTLTKPFQAGGTSDVQDGIHLVTNGETVFFTSPGNVLYRYECSTRTKTKLVALTSTMKSRIGSDSVSVTACSFYADQVYLEVEDLSSYKRYIYTYDLGTKKISKIKSGHYVTTDGRYLVYRGNTSSTLYRYDMKEKTCKTIASGDGVEAATYNGKLYVFIGDYSAPLGTLREYNYATLSYRNVMKECGYFNGGYCYQGYVYYYGFPGGDEAGQMPTRFKVNISTGKTTSISMYTYGMNYNKATSYAVFGY